MRERDRHIVIRASAGAGKTYALSGRYLQLLRAGAPPLADEAFYESVYTRQALIDVVTAAGFTIERCQPTSHSFTLWGLGGFFRAPGYYRTSRLAEALGAILKSLLPWAFNYSTLIIARK